MTKYDLHPAGKLIFEDVAGQDATEEFIDQEHSKAARKEMKQFLIGILKDEEEEVIDTWSNENKLEKKLKAKKTKLITKSDLK